MTMNRGIWGEKKPKKQTSVGFETNCTTTKEKQSHLNQKKCCTYLQKTKNIH